MSLLSVLRVETMSISASELTNYKFQLKKVEEGIVLDPENEDLKTVAEGLREARPSIILILFFEFHFMIHLDFSCALDHKAGGGAGQGGDIYLAEP